ncbi:hypothetical protein GCM10010172_75080 [Paractinoplanes ferrugineus]|uniref:Uncharacterized protein n=1 Tax=Paractinoplanes ferrugineus TaxID=113564 RepID=A0A919J0P2_9ACTN|nr:hypothetical protein [Actinoplanes ferrugineus]GIE11337.1 hypothetical protein Afe05nite_31770 [Actinoplanes ferrugineus]
MSDGAFYGYIALLFVSAILLAVLGLAGFGQSKGARIFDGIAAVAFLAYSVYLLAFFEGGEVRIFFYAFAVPVLAVIQMVKARKARAEEIQAAHPAYAGQPMAPAGHPAQPPAQYGQPGAQPGAHPGAQPAGQPGAVPPQQ